MVEDVRGCEVMGSGRRLFEEEVGFKLVMKSMAPPQLQWQLDPCLASLCS